MDKENAVSVQIENYLAIKKNEVRSSVGKLMELEEALLGTGKRTGLGIEGCGERGEEMRGSKTTIHARVEM